ncbi:MAG: tetratricopeptide repeat protein, partial [Chlamydiia bacterium]|nr:tetratricopeptide repeat protein [Chlamydiia bacterium]
KERDIYLNLRALKKKAKEEGETGDLEGAIKKYELLMREYPDNYDNHYALGRLYAQNGEYDKAIAVFEKAHALSPGSIDVEIQLAQIDFRKKEYAKAQSKTAAILKKEPKNVDALFLMGQILTRQKEDQEAADYLTRALKIDPNRNDVKLALYRLETGWGPIGEELALAREYETASQFSKAEAIYLTLLKEHPNNLGVEYRLGRLYSWMERYQKAHFYLQKVISVDPNYTDARVAYAYLLYREKRYVQASREVHVVLRKDPTNIDALVASGLIDAAVGKDDAAKKQFKAVLRQEPEMPEALIGLGRIASKRKESEKSFNYFEKAYVQNPYNYAATSGVATMRPFVFPTFFAKGSYSEERENDLILKVRTTQMNTTFGSVGAIVPLSDHVRLFNHWDYLGTEQVNLVQQIDNYMVNSFFWNFGGEVYFKRYFTLKGQNSVKWSWNSAKTLFPFENKTSWEPSLTLRADWKGLLGSAAAFFDSFIARDSTDARSFLIERKNLLLSSAYNYAPPYGLFGVEVKNINYADHFNNKKRELDAWIQSPALEYGGNYFVKYHYMWGSFKKVSPDYASYRYRARHNIRGTYLLRRDPDTQIEIDYTWSWTKERDLTNENNVILTPTLSTPQDIKKNLYTGHTIEVFFRRIYLTRLHVELSTLYYTDSNKYRAWLGKGELRYVF